MYLDTFCISSISVNTTLLEKNNLYCFFALEKELSIVQKNLIKIKKVWQIENYDMYMKKLDQF